VLNCGRKVITWRYSLEQKEKTANCSIKGEGRTSSSTWGQEKMIYRQAMELKKTDVSTGKLVKTGFTKIGVTYLSPTRNLSSCKIDAK